MAFAEIDNQMMRVSLVGAEPVGIVIAVDRIRGREAGRYRVGARDPAGTRNRVAVFIAYLKFRDRCARVTIV